MLLQWLSVYSHYTSWGLGGRERAWDERKSDRCDFTIESSWHALPFRIGQAHVGVELTWSGTLCTLVRDQVVFLVSVCEAIKQRTGCVGLD